MTERLNERKKSDIVKALPGDLRRVLQRHKEADNTLSYDGPNNLSAEHFRSGETLNFP